VSASTVGYFTLRLLGTIVDSVYVSCGARVRTLSIVTALFLVLCWVLLFAHWDVVAVF
jgi:hypothetical protein